LTTATTPGVRRTSRRTNDRAGANNTCLPANIPPRLTPIAPKAPVGRPRADGRAAWNGHTPVAVALPEASNRAPRPLTLTATPPWPVASSGGPPKQRNVPQGAYYSYCQGAFPSTSPRQPLVPSTAAVSAPSLIVLTFHNCYTVNTQGYTLVPHQTRNATLASSSHDPGLRPGGVPPPPNPRAPAPLHNGAASQRVYAAGSASAPPSQYLAEMPSSLDIVNQTYRTPTPPQVASFTEEGHSLALDAGPVFTSPLVGPGQGDSADLCICNGDHWYAWCTLVWEHYNAAVNSPLPFIRLPCSCSLGLRMGEVPKGCPRVADHLLGWVSHAYCIQRELAYWESSIDANISRATSQPVQNCRGE
jgi:hypothetical protein